MVRRPVYDQSGNNMGGYLAPGPPPVYHSYGEADQNQGPNQWQGYPQGYPPAQSSSPYPMHNSPMASSPPEFPHGPPQGSYYGPPQPQYTNPSPAAAQYPPPGHGQYEYGSPPFYLPPHQQSPNQPPASPLYAQHSSPPVPQDTHPDPQIKDEYTSPPPLGPQPQTEEERGLMGALAGGAAGGFAGHKVHHGFLGAMAGAFAGHKFQDVYKDHKHSRPSTRPSSSSSSSSSSGDSHRPTQHHAPPPPTHGTKGNYSQSSSQIALDKDHDLIAECGTVNGGRKLTSIALNRLLTNDDGHFRWSGEGNFGASARNVRLIHGGRFLEAELRDVHGNWRRDQVCLDERIENDDGNLQMIW